MKKHQYTLNESKLLEKNTSAIPQLKWIYMIDATNNKVLHISLAKLYLNIYETEESYVNILNSKIRYIVGESDYEFFHPDKNFKNLIKNSKSITFGSHSFIDNCDNTDVYTKKDFLEIYKRVLSEFFDNSRELYTNVVFDEETVKTMINDIHREYMLEKADDTKNNSEKLKCYQQLRYLKFNKFTIDNGSILEGNLKMLPKMKWIFTESEEYPHIFKIDLAVNYNLFDGREFAGIVYQNIYNVTSEGHVSFLGSRHDIVGYSSKNYSFDFHENTLHADIYDLEDIRNIIKSVSDEINEFLTTNNGNPDNINYVEEPMTRTLEYDEVKTLIKKAHREYMDNKNQME